MVNAFNTIKAILSIFFRAFRMFCTELPPI